MSGQVASVDGTREGGLYAVVAHECMVLTWKQSTGCDGGIAQKGIEWMALGNGEGD